MSTFSAIHGRDLAVFIDGPSERKTSVIVEAKRAPVGVRSESPQKLHTSARKLLPAPAQAAGGKPAARQKAISQPTARTMAAIESALTRLGLDGVARRNDLSGSFVVEVTPPQLLELAGTPAIQAIRPNKLHRRASV
jgi:hypothetical protein